MFYLVLVKNYYCSLDSLRKSRYYYYMEKKNDAWKRTYTYFPYFTFALLIVSVFIALTSAQQKQQTKSNAQIVAPTPTSSPGFTQNPLDTQVQVSIKLPGIGSDGNKYPKNLSRKVTATVYGSDNTQIAQGVGNVQFDGEVFTGIAHLGAFDDGAYTIWVSTDGTLESIVLPQSQELTKNKLNILPVVGLMYGDVEQDKTLDQSDYIMALNCFQSKTCDNIHVIDFNDDGKIDSTDYNLLLQTFLKVQGK